MANLKQQTFGERLRKKAGKKSREFFTDTLYSCFKLVPKKTASARGLRVLVYHGVCENDADRFNSRYLTTQQFEAHLQLIQKLFNTISYEDLLANRLSDKKLNVLITFDDGLKNNYTHARPLLLKYKCPAVFFVSAVADRSQYLFNDLLDVFAFCGPDKVRLNDMSFEKKKIWRHYRYVSADGHLASDCFQTLNAAEREALMQQIYAIVTKENFKSEEEYLALMNEQELRDLAQHQLFSIGSHAISHTDLSAQTPGELKTELEKSKMYLEATTGKACNSIAFPYGNYNAGVLSLSQEYYTTLFGTEKLDHAKDRPQIIERFTVNPYVSAINQMYYLAVGNYE